ncbi:hypothetical protein N9045_01790 [bacterium]|nr:hypothetical protein [bacterium]
MPTLVTGHSSKFDGICILADTNDHAEALKAAVAAWNDQFADVAGGEMTLVIADKGDYMIFAELDAERVIDEIDGEPRREGFVLYTTQITAGKIKENLPW